eukprot:scaffold111308_cov18-Tisochrysis_lutea.AAC.3
MQVTYQRLKATLNKLSKASRGGGAEPCPGSSIVDVCFGRTSPRFAATPPAWTPHNAGLDDSQRAAIGLALGAKDVALIHGPPGNKVVDEVGCVLRALGRALQTEGASDSWPPGEGGQGCLMQEGGKVQALMFSVQWRFMFSAKPESRFLRKPLPVLPVSGSIETSVTFLLGQCPQRLVMRHQNMQSVLLLNRDASPKHAICPTPRSHWQNHSGGAARPARSTGKTTAVVELILQEVARGSRVLATSASNIAVDNLVERLVRADPKMRIVRMGHPARLLPQVLDSSLEAHVLRSDNSSLAKDCRKEIKALNTQLMKLGSKCDQ